MRVSNKGVIQIEEQVQNQPGANHFRRRRLLGQDRSKTSSSGCWRNWETTGPSMGSAAASRRGPASTPGPSSSQPGAPAASPAGRPMSRAGTSMTVKWPPNLSPPLFSSPWHLNYETATVGCAAGCLGRSWTCFLW